MVLGPCVRRRHVLVRQRDLFPPEFVAERRHAHRLDSTEKTARTGTTRGRKHRRHWGVESLEGRQLLSGLIAQGSGPGAAPFVRVFDADTGAQQLKFLAYGPGMTSGVRVAVGDVTGEGVQDVITVPRPGADPVVKVFRATDGNLVGAFALPTSWGRGGVWVAAGDVTGDGWADIVVRPGLGTPWVRVYSGASGQLVESFRADAGLAPGVWRSGAKVTVGDVNGDGLADIVATPVYGQSVVGVFDGRNGNPLRATGRLQGGPGARAAWCWPTSTATAGSTTTSPRPRDRRPS